MRRVEEKREEKMLKIRRIKKIDAAEARGELGRGLSESGVGIVSIHMVTVISFDI